jgi:hypothetical protein
MDTARRPYEEEDLTASPGPSKPIKRRKVKGAREAEEVRLERSIAVVVVVW